FDRTVPSGQRERTQHDPPQSACAQRDDRRCPERGHRRPRAASAGSCAGADDICRRELDDLTDAPKDISAASQKQGHPVPTMSFTSNSRLARQIEQGAPANIFASADENWMDYLQKRNLIMNESRSNLLSNSLVLVVPASARPKGAAPVTIEPDFDRAGLLGKDGRLATGDPAHVPVGIYAEQAPRKLGLWEAVSGRPAPSDAVRAALLLVERGEAPPGIVYSTDEALPVPPAPPSIAEGSDYDSCLRLLTDDPEGASAYADAWEATGGGEGARHCHALAEIALGHATDGAQEL